MKTKIIIRTMILSAFTFFVLCFTCYGADKVDPDIPIPTNVILGSDGVVTWEISNSGTLRDYVYKKFQIKLQKRYANYSTTAGVYEYEWKDYSSIKTVTVEDNSSSEYIGSIDISLPGYYVALVRAYTVEGAYGNWSAPSDAAAFDSGTTNININDGSSIASNYGPGTVYNGGSGMQVTSPYQNYGNATNIVGTNGQYVTSNGNGTAYIYDPRYQNNVSFQGQNAVNIGSTPGTNQSFVQQYQSGPGTNAQVVTSNNNVIQTPGSYNVLSNTNQFVQYAPSQSTSSFSYNQANWSKDIGWHVDNYGFYYYLGNGIYLRNQWYLIENNYYRFNDNGYALVGAWFKDPTNNGWYYLGPQGKMMTGWQLVDGIWYYLNPGRGTTYGVMFANCSLTIDGKVYAFDSNGGCIINNYFNGYYYGADGTRQ